MWDFSHTWTFGTRCYMLLPLFHDLSTLDSTYIGSSMWKTENMVHLYCFLPSLPASTPSINFFIIFLNSFLLWLEKWQINPVLWIFNFNQHLLTPCYEMWENCSLYLSFFFSSFFLFTLYPSSPLFLGCC